MLQKSLAEMVLRVNIGRKKANLEEKSATCCKNLLQNCVEGECWEEKGKFRREKCNMLQKSLAETALRLNIGRKKTIIEEKSATCCKNLF